MPFSTEIFGQSINNIVGYLAMLFVPPILTIAILGIITARYFDNDFSRKLFAPVAGCIVVGWICYVL
ncbi:hypothetical protein CN949_01635 [Bacillus thuringiensis]|nr:hypothetical protein CN949_01635 [Bacillus thuringiensis]